LDRVSTDASPSDVMSRDKHQGTRNRGWKVIETKFPEVRASRARRLELDLGQAAWDRTFWPSALSGLRERKEDKKEKERKNKRKC